MPVSISNAARTNGKRTAVADAVKRTAQKSGAPDYANMATADLLGAWAGYVKLPSSDAATAVVNTLGAEAAAQTVGQLGAQCAICIGLRKAHGRNISSADIGKALPGVMVPAGFTPTFALLLQAVRIRPDDKAARDAATDFKRSVRDYVKALRK
jgi:hypothetical protein